jgi:hypothetical protein
MGVPEPHEHMSTPSAYEESTESISASSFSLLRLLLDQILPFASSPIDVLFPSFRIYGI